MNSSKFENKAENQIITQQQSQKPPKEMLAKFKKTVEGRFNQSKIPKREVTVKKGSELSKKFTKPILTRNPSKSISNFKLSSSNSTSANLHRSVKSNQPTPRSNISAQSSSKALLNVRKNVINKNIQSFKTIKDKLNSVQSEFFKTYELVKDDIQTEEYQVIIFPNKNFNIDSKKCEELNAFLKDMEIFFNEVYPIGDCSTQNNINPTIKEKMFSKIQDFIIKQNENIECSEKCGKFSPKNNIKDANHIKQNYVRKMLLCSSTQQEDLKKQLDKKEKEILDMLEENKRNLNHYEMKLKEKDVELRRTQNELQMLATEKESLKRDVSNEKVCSKQLQETLIQKNKELKDLNEKCKTISQENISLEGKIHEYLFKVEGLEIAYKELEMSNQLKPSISEEEIKNSEEVKNLQNNLETIHKEKENLQTEVEKLKEEIKKIEKLEYNQSILVEESHRKSAENQTLHQVIKEYESKLKATEGKAFTSRDLQEQLTKVQRGENENKRKIDHLEMELNKAHLKVKKLEEKIALDRNLLKVRSDLIDSLQKKEHTQKIRLEDLFTEVGQRNNDIQKLKLEISSQGDEFQKLFSTLSAKQSELIRQEHVNKLLQESNERAQNLRVKQEAKIGRLEEEISELKRIISFHQETVLGCNTMRNSFLEVSRDSELADSLGFYLDERRRKRHIDINVKKYEK